jgi:adenylosuccinate lyase
VIKSKKENRFLKEILFENPKIEELFTKTEIDALMNPHNYIGKAIELTENFLKYLKNKYEL